ncbi:STAS domain-containing protein [Phytohabitans sp. LJ34]|uniref:STAS domain-containing protein n=1 Tax=Phytohabitans sp. LJ34 TaxID=3452217 RepID=UPI003F8A8481
MTGEIDHSTHDAFDAAVRAVLAGYPGSVVLDLTAVPFISSEGASALVDAGQRAADAETRLTIKTSHTVWRRLELLGLTQIMDLTAVDPPPAGQAPAPAPGPA